MDNNSSDDKRRKYHRLRSYCLVRYHKVADTGKAEEKTTNVRNISEGGLMLTSYEPLPVDSTVKVMINFPGREEPVETVVKVMRCVKASETEEVYHVGVLFLDISEQDRNQIHSHVERALHDKRGKRLIERRHWWQFWRRKKIRLNTKPEESSQ